MVLLSNFNKTSNFNQLIEDNFYKNTIKILKNTTERFLIENKTKIFKKDKSVLKDIITQKLNLKALGGVTRALNDLWDISYKAGERQATGSNFSLWDSLAEFALNEDIAKVQRKVDSQETMVGAVLSNTDFGKDYLRYRNKVVAQNFTDAYSDKIFSSINNYMNSDRKIDNTRILLDDLGMPTPQEMSDQERSYYDRWLKSQKITEKEIPNVYGLRKEVVEDPKRYDHWKYDLRNRIKRIARTENTAAFNLGRINVYMEDGYTEFIWRTDGEKDCFLCNDKNGDIVTIRDLAISVANYENIGWTDFNKVYTLAGKNDYGTTPSGRSYDNTTAVFAPIHPHCSCKLIPREEGRRSKFNVEAEKVLSKTQKFATSALSLFKKTNAVAAIGFGAMSLGDEYVRQAEELKQQEQDNIISTIFEASSILAGGFLMFYFIQKHPQFVATARKLGISIGKKIVNAEIEKKKRKALTEYKKAKENYFLNMMLEDTAEEDQPQELQAYTDFTNLGLSPVLSGKLISELRGSESKSNYHDLVATKLREYLFGKLTPMQMNLLSDMENLSGQTKFWENNFGKEANTVMNITAAIQNHLGLAKAAGNSDIISIAPPAGISRFQHFMKPSLQDIAVGGKYVFKGKNVGVNSTKLSEIVNGMRNEVGRELIWSTDKAELKKRLISNFNLSSNNADEVVNNIQSAFPGTRSGLPTGNNLILKAEKLHPISIPNVNSKQQLSDFSSRLENIKSQASLSDSALDNLEADILNYQKEVDVWGRNDTKQQLDRILLNVNDARSLKPLTIPEPELVPIKLESKKPLAKKAAVEPLPVLKRSEKIKQKEIEIGESFKRQRDLYDYNQAVATVENIEKQLDDIARSWSDPNSFESSNLYLSSSRSSKRSINTERKLINLHGQLRREKNRMSDNSFIVSKINDILKNKLNIVKTTNRGKKVIGSNNLFPEKLEGAGLSIAREKTKISEQFKIINATKNKSQKLVKNRIGGDNTILKNSLDGVDKQLKSHARNTVSGKTEDIKKENIRLNSIIRTNKQKISTLNEKHNETAREIKSNIAKKIKNITASNTLREKEKTKLVDALGKTREENLNVLEKSKKLTIEAIENYNNEIRKLVKK